MSFVVLAIFGSEPFVEFFSVIFVRKIMV